MSNWVEKLRAYNASKAEATDGTSVTCDDEKAVQRMTSQFCQEWRKPDKSEKTYEHIPRFYRKAPDENDTLRQRLREEARAHHVQRKSKQILNSSDLDVVWALLQTLASSQENDEKMITYDDFVRIGREAGERFNSYFKPTTFAKLFQQDSKGRISINRLYAYIMRKVWLQQTRIGLSLYDVSGIGVLTEMDFENYILELIPTLPLLSGLEDSFYSFFVCTAVRKFFFFLDPLRTGKIKIQDIMACKFLDDLLELRDDTLSLEHQRRNWFSAPHALQVYGNYLDLDLDHNGMLSKQELMGYGTGTLTPVFVDRVFEECLTYEGEMDYKSYLDFVLAMEHRKEPQAMHFFYRLLDIQNLGHIDMFAVYYFFKDIQRMLEAHGQPIVNFEDVKDEIFDMVKPDDPYKITLKDMMRSGQGSTVVSMLIDLNGFWLYENREQLATEPSQGEDDDEDDLAEQDRQDLGGAGLAAGAAASATGAETGTSVAGDSPAATGAGVEGGSDVIYHYTDGTNRISVEL